MLDVAIRRSHPAALSDAPDGPDDDRDAPTVCRLDGELVSSAAPVVRALRGRLAHAKTLLVDLRGVGAFDRPGLGALVGVLRGAHPGTGRVRVCADQPALVRLLRAEGLDRLYPLVTRPDQPAVAARP
jgi:anti-anti-sigma factor